MNETYQQPGRWHDIILAETANNRLNNDDASERIMSHHLHGLEASSIYEAIVQGKNRYGWSEVSSYFNSPPTRIVTLPVLGSVSFSWRFNNVFSLPFAILLPPGE